MRPLLKQVAELIGGAIRELRNTLEPRLKSLEDSTQLTAQKVREDLDAVRSSQSKANEAALKFELDAKDLQKLLEECRSEVEKAHSQQAEAMRAALSKAEDAARQREATQNELVGELRALLVERSGAPTIQALVAEVVASLREERSAEETRVLRLIEVAVNEMRPLLEISELAKSVAGLLPSEEAVANAVLKKLPPAPDMDSLVQRAAAAVKIPAAPDLSAFLTQDQAKELIAQDRVQHAPAAPDVQAIARAAAGMIELPAAPDVSGFLTLEKARELIDSDRTRNQPPAPDLPSLAGEVVKLLPAAPDLQEVARAAASFVPVAAVPDISGLVRGEELQQLLTAERRHFDSALEKAISNIPAVPELQAIANAVTQVIQFPPAPDVSRFMTNDNVLDLIRLDNEKNPAPQASEVAKQAAELISVPSVAELARAAAALIEPPKDGESFTLEQAQALVQKALASVPMPTAEQVAGVLDLTHVSKWALDFERRAQDLLIRSVERLPVPKDGVDGMGFEDLKVTYDGRRTFTFSMARGERVKSFDFKVPVMIYHGVFDEAKLYDQGDTVTWGGSSWVALKDNPTGQPGKTNDWQLMVKKGRDGTPK